MVSTLQQLLESARALSPSQPGWLLEASLLSEEIADSIVSNAGYLDVLRRAVTDAAAANACDWIIGAGSNAERVVADLSTGVDKPSRVLVFELVRVTGSTFRQAQERLRDVEVVPAVLLNLQDGHHADHGPEPLGKLEELLSG